MNGTELTKTMTIITCAVGDKVQTLNVFAADWENAFMPTGVCKPSATLYILLHISSCQINSYMPKVKTPADSGRTPVKLEGQDESEHRPRVQTAISAPAGD